jgi:hypothetical protein
MISQIGMAKLVMACSHMECSLYSKGIEQPATIFTSIDESHKLNIKGKFSQNRRNTVIIHFILTSKQGNIIYVVESQERSDC